jgi:hypothetical protein
LSRIATRKQDFEHGTLVLVYDLKGKRIGKKIFTKYEELSDEVAPYGGRLHLNAGFIKDGKILLIFHSNGFDGYLHEVYELTPNSMKEIALGGGDAC